MIDLDLLKELEQEVGIGTVVLERPEKPAPTKIDLRLLEEMESEVGLEPTRAPIIEPALAPPVTEPVQPFVPEPITDPSAPPMGGEAPVMPLARTTEVVGRTTAKFVNDFILDTVEAWRPSSLYAVGSRRHSQWQKEKREVEKETGRSFDDRALRDMPRYLWAYLKSAYGNESRARQAIAHAKLKEKRGAYSIELPPPKGVEKGTDIAAGLAALITKIWLLKKVGTGAGVIPKGSITGDMAVWEAIGLTEQDIPGKMAGIRGGLGLIGKLPTGSVTGKTAKVIAESGLFAGATAALGGEKEDIIIAALIPVAFNAWHFAKQKSYITNYEKSLKEAARISHQTRMRGGMTKTWSESHLKRDLQTIEVSVARAKQKIYSDDAFAPARDKWEVQRQRALKMVASGKPRKVRVGNDILDFLEKRPGVPGEPIETQIKQAKQAGKVIRAEKFVAPAAVKPAEAPAIAKKPAAAPPVAKPAPKVAPPKVQAAKEAKGKIPADIYYSPELDRTYKKSEVRIVKHALGTDWFIGDRKVSRYKAEDFLGEKSIAMAQPFYEKGRAKVLEEYKSEKWAQEVLKEKPVAAKPKIGTKAEIEARKAEPPTKKEYGFAFVKDKQRPFDTYREITKGYKKGQFELTLPDGKKAIVERKAIRSFPKEKPIPKLPPTAKVKPKEKGFVSIEPLGKAHKTFLRVVEPSKIVERKLGKEVYATVIKAVHEPEVAHLKFAEQQIEGADKTFGQLEEWFSKYSEEDLENVMLTRGHNLKGRALGLQKKAFATLPKELKESKIRRAIEKVQDFNYKYLQEVAGDDINKVRDYFYGIYKSPKLIAKFLKYWKTTDRFTKHKIFPTYADAKAYGLEIRDPNPVRNLLAEYVAISHLDSMNKLKEELMRTGEGKYIAKTKDAPVGWDTIGEGLPVEPTFNDVRVEPDLARLINNLIATNKITKIPALNALRQINNVLRTIKFVGSAFHLLSVAKQSVADSGYLGFLHKPTAVKGVTTGFRKDDPIFKTSVYKDYIKHGGGHRYSVESEAQRAFSKMVQKLTKSERLMLKAGGLPFKIPLGFVNWMFRSYIPKVKYSKYLDTVAEKEKKLKRPLKSSEKIDIIKEQQNFYGMMNERLFGRSGTFTTMLRFWFMSPGYAEGNYRTIIKGAIQWRGKEGFKANRSRSNILNSLLISTILATVGTLIMTGKWPEKPESLDDLRDLAKIDTGKKDERGRRIMIDMLTYDKDYWNVVFNTLRLRPDKAVSLSIKRIGGMKAPTAQMAIDLTTIALGKALYDWKEDRVYYLTDPFLTKVMKTVRHETERVTPISASVFRQSRERGIDKVTAAVEMLLGLRPTYTEKDRREFKIVRDIWSLRDQREKLSYKIGQYKDPMAAVRKYNATIQTIIDSKFITDELKQKAQKLLIDERKVKIWKRYPAGTMTPDELRIAMNKLRNKDGSIQKGRREQYYKLLAELNKKTK